MGNEPVNGVVRTQSEFIYKNRQFISRFFPENCNLPNLGVKAGLALGQMYLSHPLFITNEML